MPKSTKQILREKISRLKKAINQVFNPGREKRLPQLLPIPVFHKKYLRGTDLL